MLYLIDVIIDYARIGDLNRLIEKEWARSDELYESGIMLGIWRKANTRGAVVIWDVPDHETLYENIKKMPLYPYFSSVRLTPLLPHPRFPQFAKKD